MKVDISPFMPLPTEARFQARLEDTLRTMSRAINDADMRAGVTGDRPVGSDLRTGRLYFDTTLGKMIVYNGAAWVNVDGTAL